MFWHVAVTEAEAVTIEVPVEAGITRNDFVQTIEELVVGRCETWQW